MGSSGNGWHRNDSFTVIGLTLMVTAAFVFFRKSLLIIKILGTCNYGKRGEAKCFPFRYLSIYRGGNMKRNLVLGGIFYLIRCFYILLLVIGWRLVHIILRLALTIRRSKRYKRKKLNVGKRSSRI